MNVKNYIKKFKISRIYLDKSLREKRIWERNSKTNWREKTMNMSRCSRNNPMISRIWSTKWDPSFIKSEMPICKNLKILKDILNKKELICWMSLKGRFKLLLRNIWIWKNNMWKNMLKLKRNKRRISRILELKEQSIMQN